VISYKNIIHSSQNCSELHMYFDIPACTYLRWTQAAVIQWGTIQLQCKGGRKVKLLCYSPRL